MELSSVILRVADLDAAQSFWTELIGLPVVHALPAFVFLDAGGVQLILNHVEGGVTDESLTEVVFTVDDVEKTFDEMSGRGVPFEVHLRPISSDGERTMLGAHFRDPDGHYGSVTGWVEGV